MSISPEMRKALLDADLKKVRNDSHRTAEHVAGKMLLDGVELHYGDIIVVVEGNRLAETRQAVNDMPAERRQEVQASVDAALRKALPKIQRGRFSKKVADNFYWDLMLWTALKELP